MLPFYSSAKKRILFSASCVQTVNLFLWTLFLSCLNCVFPSFLLQDGHKIKLLFLNPCLFIEKQLHNPIVQHTFTISYTISFSRWKNTVLYPLHYIGKISSKTQGLLNFSEFPFLIVSIGDIFHLQERLLTFPTPYDQPLVEDGRVNE